MHIPSSWIDLPESSLLAIYRFENNGIDEAPMLETDNNTRDVKPLVPHTSFIDGTTTTKNNGRGQMVEFLAEKTAPETLSHRNRLPSNKVHIVNYFAIFSQKVDCCVIRQLLGNVILAVRASSVDRDFHF